VLNRQEWLEVDIQGWLTAMEFLNSLGIRTTDRGAKGGQHEGILVLLPEPYGPTEFTKPELVRVARVVQTALEMQQRRQG
jgi:hypothetical protein